MYFTNINNPELKCYHRKVKTSKAILLTEALSNSNDKGFKVEPIINNKIYKIYPMFYCDEISSTNTNDRIFDSRMIICEKKDDTILQFKTNEEVEQ